MPPLPSRTRPVARVATVHAVGQRVFVNCPGDRAGSVVLTDESGKIASATLPDGVEVEVLSWRPRGSSGTRYRVQVSRDGVGGWLHADNLRATLVPLPPPERPEGVTPKLEDEAVGGRRFGQRSWPRR